MSNKKDLRIVITGASGVGKTTLVEKLAQSLNLPLIPELARDICKQLGYEQLTDIPDQSKFKKLVLDAQIEAENKLDRFVADRSTIDAWVLWQRWHLCSAMSYDSEHFYDVARNQAARYTHIVYVPPMFPVPDDGFRWTDADYQKQIDRLTRMTLFDWDLWQRTFVVKSSHPDDRLDETLLCLQNA